MLIRARATRLASATLLAPLLALAMVPAGAGAVGYEDSPFCRGEVVEEFGLDDLPPVSPLPEELPFGPRSVELWGGADSGRIVQLGESFGYHFTDRDYHRDPLVEWQVRARLRALDEAGNVVGTVDRGRLWIKRVKGAGGIKMYLQPPRAPGFYRYDIRFSDRRGRLLGAYSEYLKVVLPIWAPALATDYGVYRPGGLVLSRVENHGTESVLLGEDFRLQRLRGGEWAGVPGVAGGGWLLWLGSAEAGATGRCSALKLPQDIAPGEYRIVKEVGRSPAWPREGRSYFLTAPFTVR